MKWIIAAAGLWGAVAWAQDATPSGANCEVMRTCPCAGGYSDYMECPTPAMCQAACESEGGVLGVASGQAGNPYLSLPGSPPPSTVAQSSAVAAPAAPAATPAPAPVSAAP